jgi:hypothetical protein
MRGLHKKQELKNSTKRRRIKLCDEQDEQLIDLSVTQEQAVQE